MGKLKGLKTSKGSELLSYIINQDPILSENIDLPRQGQSIAPIGKIIVDNQRYKNAFINAINLIAVTLVKRNDWSNPWEEFTEQGKIDFGQSVREMIVDLVEAQDYNEHMNSATHFLEQEVPEVYNYIHNINFQKFYKVSVNDTEIAMAFTNESNMYDLIESIYSRLYESYKYDKYIVDKYQLCRRIIDGTVPSVTIADFDTNDARANVAIMKGYSNKLTFRTPKYNPAGLRLATSFENQRLIVNTEFEAQISTEVLATSYFLNEAQFKTKAALIDGFSDFDEQRLANLLGDQYVEFSEDEISKLANVVGMIIDDGFFMDFYYAMDDQAESTGATKNTEFYNPETLVNTLWLHAWRIFSTSPFSNAIVFTKDASTVTSVTVSPSTANVTPGQQLQFSASVETTGITNQAVQWTVDSSSAADGVTINASGLLSVPSDVSVESITVTATSIYDDEVSGTASVTVGSGGDTDEEVGIVSVTVTPNNIDIPYGSESVYFAASVIAIGDVSTAVTWSIDPGSSVDEPVITLDENTGVVTINELLSEADEISVRATSVYDEEVFGIGTVTIGEQPGN